MLLLLSQSVLQVILVLMCFVVPLGTLLNVEGNFLALLLTFGCGYSFSNYFYFPSLHPSSMAGVTIDCTKSKILKIRNVIHNYKTVY